MGSRGVNKVLLIGNLTKDPDVRYLPNGNAVANFSIATNESWKDQKGVKQERTEYHNIVMFKKVAEIAGEYLRKGSSVFLEGKLQTSSWDDKETGQKRYKTEINCHDMQMLGGKASGGGQQQAQQQGGYTPKPQAPQQSQKPAPQPQQLTTPDLDDGWDDDIPF